MRRTNTRSPLNSPLKMIQHESFEELRRLHTNQTIIVSDQSVQQLGLSPHVLVLRIDTVKMGLVGRIVRFLGGLLSIGVLVAAIFVGWLIHSPQGPAEGILFATIFPLLSFQLPPTLVGHGKMTGVDVVPDDFMPQLRPSNELFLELPFGQRMPQNGLGMCCRPTGM
jgi:hypothetical protein